MRDYTCVSELFLVFLLPGALVLSRLLEQPALAGPSQRIFLFLFISDFIFFKMRLRS